MIGAAELAERHALRRVPGRAEWRGNCPSCGYAEGLVLTLRDGRPMWWCASCSGDRAALTAAMLGTAERSPIAAPQRSGPPPAVAAERTRRALTIWTRARPLAGTVAATYLTTRRVLDALAAHPPHPAGPALRFLPDAKHPDGCMRPALLALVRRSTDAEPVAVHRTFLRRDGSAKADADPQRASVGPVAGGAIMLHEPDRVRGLVVAEGVESAASASALLTLPAWACVSAGNLAAFTPPADLAELVIAADADDPGQRAAWTCAQRLRAAGLRVRIATPDTPGADFNDMHRAMEGTGHAG